MIKAFVNGSGNLELSPEEITDHVGILHEGKKFIFADGGPQIKTIAGLSPDFSDTPPLIGGEQYENMEQALASFPGAEVAIFTGTFQEQKTDMLNWLDS